MPDSNITKKALAQAMKELMAETPFSKINVGEICLKCGMNRKSFYYHFKDKYDLVNWIYYTEFVERVNTERYESIWDFLNDICNYFYANRSFYVNALQIKGQNSFEEYFAEVLHAIILSYFSDVFDDGEYQNFHAVFFTDAFRMSITRWLSENAKIPPKKFVELLKAAASGTAQKMVQDLKWDRQAQEEAARPEGNPNATEKEGGCSKTNL
ncbi:MAG: TetR/AcrR family transcriptional regulator C-terminal domain-containing protein [Oscillospiraceae bacterium]|nr:TetR/AcrR family transcriptional regulator C-terminal domain-containing protein [Oscillospiraceae bacterium]